LQEHRRINAGAGYARNATQHDEHWLARSFAFPESTMDVVVNPALVILHRRPVLAHRAFTIFDGLCLKQ
jgi:hypothetical protein